MSNAKKNNNNNQVLAADATVVTTVTDATLTANLDSDTTPTAVNPTDSEKAAIVNDDGTTADTTVDTTVDTTSTNTDADADFPDTAAPTSNADTKVGDAEPDVKPDEETDTAASIASATTAETPTGPKVGVTVISGENNGLPTEKAVASYEDLQKEQLRLNEEVLKKPAPKVGRTVPEHTATNTNTHPNSPVSAQLPDAIVRMRAEAAAKAAKSNG